MKKLGGSPSSRPRRRPAVALPLRPKAPQAPQRKRQRNSTNSSSPTYPHLPKRPHAANTQHLGKEQKGTSPLKASPKKQRTRQQQVNRKALSPGESRERSGPVEFFTRSRTIGITSINRANANAASKSQKRLFTYTTSCGGYRVKKLGGSPSSRPRRRPSVASPLPCCPAVPLPYRCPQGAASAAENTQTKFH